MIIPSLNVSIYIVQDTVSIKRGPSLTVELRKKKSALSGCYSRPHIPADMSGHYVPSTLKHYLGCYKGAINKPPNLSSLGQHKFISLSWKVQCRCSWARVFLKAETWRSRHIESWGCPLQHVASKVAMEQGKTEPGQNTPAFNSMIRSVTTPLLTISRQELVTWPVQMKDCWRCGPAMC